MNLHNETLSGRAGDDFKRRCISIIVYVICVALCLYSIIVYVSLNDKNLALATFIYFVLLLYTFLLIRKTYKIKILVHLYLIFDPLFAAFIMPYFLTYSAGTALWILPVPIGAYVLLEKKYVYIYTLYVLLIVSIVTFTTKFLMSETLNFHDTDISDGLVGVSNVIIVVVLLYYNDKIKSAKIMAKIERYRNSENIAGFNLESAKIDNENKNLKENISGHHRDADKYNEIFQYVKNIVEEEFYFKDANFTISQLSHLIKINTLYIATSIKLNGYSGFNYYINFCRIQYVKELIRENDLSKITLMYIYTSSGFSSQSTFNRVFKQIEGITPTEYISNL